LRSSVVYRLAVFGSAGDGRPADEPAALGRFVHVYVDRDTRRPAPIPERIAAALEALTPSGRADAGRAQTSAPRVAAGDAAPRRGARAPGSYALG
jgi:hypothetical protein